MSVNVSPYLVYGTIPTGQAILQPGGVLKSSRDGAAVLTQQFKCNFSDLQAGNVSIAQGAGHPTFPTLQIWSVGFTQEKAGICTLEVESRGLSPNLGGIPDPTYSLERTLSNEPLATHPLWATQIAGTPSNALNGSIWVDPTTGNISTNDATAVFKGWSVTSIFAGIEDYLSPGQTWSVHYVDYSPPADLTAVGTIDTPSGPVPQIPANYFWLYTGCNFTQQGSVYQISETWKLSGGAINAASAILYGGS